MIHVCVSELAELLDVCFVSSIADSNSKQTTARPMLRRRLHKLTPRLLGQLVGFDISFCVHANKSHIE